jgi:hypothetical protein
MSMSGDREKNLIFCVIYRLAPGTEQTSTKEVSGITI